MKDWIEIFRCGTHTSANGTTKEWTETDLDKMVDGYGDGEHEAPVVIGHPQSNDPAYGWVDKIKRDGKLLLAKFNQVAPEFAEMVKKGMFKKRSIAVYPNGTLRHVGFLGAQPPAVKGLRDIAFSDGDAEIYEYAEKEAGVMPTVEELQAQLAEEKKKRAAAEEEARKAKESFAEGQRLLKKKELLAFVDDGIAKGTMLPGWKKQGIVEFMQDLDGRSEVIEFAEGKKETVADWFSGFLATFSEHPLFKEMTRDESGKKEQDDFAEDQKIADEIAQGKTGDKS